MDDLLLGKRGFEISYIRAGVIGESVDPRIEDAVLAIVVALEAIDHSRLSCYEDNDRNAEYGYESHGNDDDSSHR